MSIRLTINIYQRWSEETGRDILSKTWHCRLPGHFSPPFYVSPLTGCWYEYPILRRIRVETILSRGAGPLTLCLRITRWKGRKRQTSRVSMVGWDIPIICVSRVSASISVEWTSRRLTEKWCHRECPIRTLPRTKFLTSAIAVWNCHAHADKCKR